MKKGDELLVWSYLNGALPNSFTFNALVDGCAKAADMERAFKVLSEMLEHGIACRTKDESKEEGAAMEGHCVRKRSETQTLSVTAMTS